MTPRVLLVHNHYRERGGEDRVFENEASLLAERGVPIARYTRHNDEVDSRRPFALVRSTIWNRRSYRETRDLIRRHGSDVVHVHNTLPLVSPSVYHAAKAEGAAVVQSLHNFRLYCPSAQFWRNGGPCEDCAGKAVPLPAVVHACYRSSRAASGAVAAMLSIHRALGTWTRNVDLFIAPSDYVRQKMVALGMAADRLVVKYHSVPDTGVSEAPRRGALFVGRLAPEKGVGLLLKAAEDLGPSVELTIAGDGPLAHTVSEAARRCPWIEYVGPQSADRIVDLMGAAEVVVVPSLSHETFGLVVAESYARGTPVIASRSGALAELVEHGRTGRLFRPGDPSDLADKLREFCVDRTDRADVRRAARARFERSFTPDANSEALIGMYHEALRRSRSEAA